MNIRKFIAPTARQALEQIRVELGAEAMILSNRKTENGVEIIALANGEIEHLTDRAESRKTDWTEAKPVVWVQPEVEDKPVEQVKPAPQVKQAPPVKPVVQAKPVQQAKPVAQAQPIVQAEPVRQEKTVQVSEPVPAALVHENILSEIKSMSSMLQQQLAAMHWNDVQQRDPQRASLLRRLLNSGFSTLLARQMLDKMPAGNQQGEAWIKQVFKRNIRVASEADDIVSKGGVYALIGPTGVGKTTTTAKLAARAVVRYGADKVALLTTDSYRIAAYEQLKIYGKILGVAVHAVKDTDDLRLTLSALRHKHLVLIDTVGMGQRDERVAEQNEMFEATGVQCLLMLNATSGGDTLEDVVRMYRSKKVIGCIATKLDEAVNLGTVLDVAVRHRLVMHYMANGQRVPEDLHLVNLDYLLHRALKPADERTPFAMHELDFPVLMAGNPSKEVAYALG